jgi:hypothetical protein
VGQIVALGTELEVGSAEDAAPDGVEHRRERPLGMLRGERAAAIATFRDLADGGATMPAGFGASGLGALVRGKDGMTLPL